MTTEERKALMVEEAAKREKERKALILRTQNILAGLDRELAALNGVTNDFAAIELLISGWRAKKIEAEGEKMRYQAELEKLLKQGEVKKG